MSKNRTHLPLYRLDWNPKNNHLNANYGPEDLRGLPIKAGQTHEHLYEWNIIEKSDDLRENNVQIAKIIDHDLKNYDEALNFFCERINLRDSAQIPNRPAQGSLF